MKWKLLVILSVLFACALINGVFAEGLDINYETMVLSEKTEETVFEDKLFTLGEDCVDANETPISSNTSYFEIKDGVLKKYTGNDADVVIPAGVIAIGRSAFEGNLSIQSVMFPEGINSIGSRAFCNCKGLKYVDLCDSLENIGDFAFGGCNGLQSFSLPANVTMLGDHAFSGCVGIKQFIFNEALKTIGNSCFSGCIKLEVVDLPNTVTSIGALAFENTTNLTTINLSNNLTSIGIGTFSRSGVVSIVIPGSLKDISNSAFSDCKQLTSLTISEGVQALRYNAFFGCVKLNSVTIPSSMIYIGENAFNKCEGLTSLIFMEGIKEIDDFAFSGCTALTSLALPNSLTSINYRGFADTVSLKEVTFGTGLTSMGREVFRNSAITSVKLPNSLANIPAYAFYECKNLKEAYIPNSITVIGRGAFSCCGALESITLPDSVTTLDSDVFSYCTSLLYAIVPANVTYIGNNLFLVANQVTVYDELDSEMYKYCERNNIPHKRIGEPLPHKHIPVMDPAIAPTYKKAGKTEGSHCAICNQVLVPQETVPKLQPTSIKLNKSKTTLRAGKTLQLKTTIYPKHKTSKYVKLKWTTNNKKVAKVSSKGKVTALKPGTAVITVKTTNGVTATCTITVKGKK